MIETVRPLNVVLVIVGDVVSASVNVIGPDGHEVLAVLRLDRACWPGSGSRTCRSRWPSAPAGSAEADRELDDRGVGRVVDGDRRTDVDRDARRDIAVNVRSAADDRREVDRLVEGHRDGAGRDGDGRPVGRVGGRPPASRSTALIALIALTRP